MEYWSKGKKFTGHVEVVKIVCSTCLNLVLINYIYRAIYHGAASVIMRFRRHSLNYVQHSNTPAFGIKRT